MMHMDMCHPILNYKPGMNLSLAQYEPNLPSYFGYSDYSTLMFAHIALMTVAWFALLPIGMSIGGGRSD